MWISRALVLVLAGLAVVPGGSATTVRSVTTPGPVVALAMDGRRVAYADGRSARDCDRVRVWNLQTRGVTTFRRPTSCVQTSTGTGIASLALAGDRVLWLHFGGGNIREWRLFTASVRSRAPRLLRFVAADVDAAPPIVVGGGETSRFGNFLPYAVGRDVVVLDPNGSRRFAWRAPARVTALSALFGRLAVASEGGLVTILDASGRPVGTERFAGEIRAVRVSGGGVLVQIGRTLELRRPGLSRRYVLPARALLADAIGDRALYAAGDEIRQLSLLTAADRSVRPGSLAQAALASMAIADGRRVIVQPLP